MRLLVTGAGGQVGRALVEFATARGDELRGLDRAALDVCDAAAIGAALEDFRPDWVLHCAAATKVDLCESEIDWAEGLNARAPAALAAACKALEIGFLQYSTDFVFDGLKGRPYVEDDACRPLSVYGASKLRGEQVVRAAGLARWLIVRTQWVYGPQGRCFPAAILDRARSGQALRVVDDQIGSPTLSLDLAEASLDLLAAFEAGRAESGIYHASASGELSWWSFAREILDAAGFEELEIERCKGASLALPAKRPGYSTLDCAKLEAVIGRKMPSYAQGLERWLEAEGLSPAARSRDSSR